MGDSPKVLANRRKLDTILPEIDEIDENMGMKKYAEAIKL